MEMWLPWLSKASVAAAVVLFSPTSVSGVLVMSCLVACTFS